MYLILPEYDHDVERHDLEGEFKQNEEAVQDHEVTSDLQNIANFLWVESRACSWCYSVMIAHKKILWILPPGFRTTMSVTQSYLDVQNVCLQHGLSERRDWQHI